MPRTLRLSRPALAALAALALGAGHAGPVLAAPQDGETSAARAPRRAWSRAQVAARLKAVTAPWRGAPYGVSPLGEGAGTDADPPLRYDTFDCTTFVETALASLPSSADESVIAHLQALRYHGGQVAFGARRHFPGAEWTPGLIAQGVLTDVTKRVAGPDASFASKTLSPAVWDRRKRPTVLELSAARVPTGETGVWVLPLAAYEAHADAIPDGTVLNVVRVNYKNVPVRITHQGLVLRIKGKTVLRHAADRMYHSVVDEPLAHFVARMRKYKRWPVFGFQLLAVNGPPVPAAPVAIPLTGAPLAPAPIVPAREPVGAHAARTRWCQSSLDTWATCPVR